MERPKHSPRDIVLFHAVQAKELLGRAGGDESSKFFQIGTEALATARDEARSFGLDPTKLEADADEVLAKLNKEENKILGDSFPKVIRQDAGFPTPRPRKRGW